MIKIMKQLFYEPLLHFFLLGGLFYLYYDSKVEVPFEAKIPIVISEYEIRQMKLQYAQEMNDEVLKALVAKRYYEKILLDKAYSIKLAQNDQIISNRLLQQMEFVMLDGSKDKEPTEEELREYYEKNIDDYSHVKTLSFHSVYFRNDKESRVDSTYKLLTVADVNASEAKFFGEKSELPNEMRDATYEKISAMHGKFFADKLFKLKQGVWHKEIQSTDGVRIVYVTDKKVATSYKFDEVEDRVYNDYLAQNRKKIKENAYKEIASQYSLKSS